MAGPIHYEVYVRKTAPSAWSLLIATESRKHAIETAEDQMADRLAAATGDALVRRGEQSEVEVLANLSGDPEHPYAVVLEIGRAHV